MWGAVAITFDITIRQEPYALLNGYWTDGEPRRKGIESGSQPSDRVPTPSRTPLCGR